MILSSWVLLRAPQIAAQLCPSDSVIHRCTPGRALRNGFDEGERAEICLLCFFVGGEVSEYSNLVGERSWEKLESRRGNGIDRTLLEEDIEVWN